MIPAVLCYTAHMRTWILTWMLGLALLVTLTGAAILPAQSNPEAVYPVRLVELSTGQTWTLQSSTRLPADWLVEAGVALNPEDQLLLNGARVQADRELPPLGAYTLQIRRAVPVTLVVDGKTRTLTSAGPTLGDALWEAGITLSASDNLSLPLSTPLLGPVGAELQTARPIQIHLGDQIIQSATSAQIVGEALAEAGLPLQGLDYSIPAEYQPIPADGIIRVTQVREEITLEQNYLPYESEFQPDPEIELDQRAVTQPGEFGVEVSRVRVRYENGQEVSREAEDSWVAKEPKNEVVGYGTKVVIKTLDTPSGPIEYWRAVTVYATSYSPCRSAADRCYYGTSSGLPVARGVIGVTRSWYNWFVGQRLYVPGYGTGVVADVGGGVPGEYWIDLGFTDADFEPWHQYVTIYFLTPVPENIPWILP